jgi:predicted ATPase
VLCEQFEEGPEHFTALWNLWMNRTVKAEYDKAQELCGELLSLAPKLKKSDFFLQAGHAAWTTQFTLGELLATAMHTDDGRDIYDRQAHASHSFSYGGHDPGVCCNAISALNFWLLGYPDKSLAAAHAAIDLADEIDIPFSSCQASVYGAYAYQFRGEEREVEIHGNKAVTMASENGFPHWLGWGFMATCWAHVRQGRHENEIENMRRSLEELRSAGFAFFMPYQKSLLADACGLLDEPEEGLAVTLEALKMAQESGECWWQAELHRQEGEFRLAIDGSAAAESCFATAIELAQRQSAKSLELRAATSLARYWHAEGKRVEARDLLYPVYSWFTEGFDTADLLAAKRFLDELA